MFEQIVSPAELQSRKRSCLPPGSPQGTFERSRVRTGRSKVVEFMEKKARRYFLGVRLIIRSAGSGSEAGFSSSWLLKQTAFIIIKTCLRVVSDPAIVPFVSNVRSCSLGNCSYCCHLPTLTAARCGKKAFGFVVTINPNNCVRLSVTTTTTTKKQEQQGLFKRGGVTLWKEGEGGEYVLLPSATKRGCVKSYE